MQAHSHTTGAAVSSASLGHLFRWTGSHFHMKEEPETGAGRWVLSYPLCYSPLPIVCNRIDLARQPGRVRNHLDRHQPILKQSVESRADAAKARVSKQPFKTPEQAPDIVPRHAAPEQEPRDEKTQAHAASGYISIQICIDSLYCTIALARCQMADSGRIR